MKKIALYPGSFDPLTFGHLDLIKRLSRIFDEVVVGVGINPTKPSLFTSDERVGFVREICADMKNVKAAPFNGLAVDFAKTLGAKVLVRGIRTEIDFTFEMQMAMMNRVLAADIEVMFLLGSKEYSHISSTLVKEVASYRQDVSFLVPPLISKKLNEKLAGN